MIDCDLHNEVSNKTVLYPYMPKHWVHYAEESDYVGPDAYDHPVQIATSIHPDWRDVYRDPELSTVRRVALMQEHVLDPLHISLGILNTTYRIQSLYSLDLAVDMATAVNTWQAEEWLNRDARFRASLVVPSQQPDLAVAEIQRWQDHPGFVQVVLPVRARLPYGNRFYDPMFKAIVDADLRMAISFGGATGNPPTGVGWPSTFYEMYVGMAQIFQSQVMSMVYEGVFDRFPDLHVALLEGGFTWLPSLMWRLNKEWKGLRHTIPWVKHWPSEYMRRHFRWTLHPLDAGESAEQMQEILFQIGAEDLLLFSTDYPHWHYDSLDHVIPDYFSSDLVRKMCFENPKSFYNL